MATKPPTVLHEQFLENGLLFIEQMIDVKNRHLSDQSRDDSGDEDHWSIRGHALVRHFKRWNGHGEPLDPKSGYHNLVHVAVDALWLWSLERSGEGLDNRPATKAFQVLDDTPPEAMTGNL